MSILQNLKSELNVTAYKNCKGGDAAPAAILSCMGTQKTSMNENYEGLDLSNIVNKRLISANKGRGLASSSDWDSIGENSDDACEVTASNGRNNLGFDLSAFDLNTGAAPIGDFGLGK